MLNIHDIKPIVKIPDYTIYLYYSLILICLLIAILVLYFIYKYFKNRKDSIEKAYLQNIKNIDFKNSKQSAYTISKYGRLLANTNRQKRLFDELNSSLEEFKYKKVVSNNIPQEIQAQYDIFLESLDV